MAGAIKYDNLMMCGPFVFDQLTTLLAGATESPWNDVYNLYTTAFEAKQR